MKTFASTKANTFFAIYIILMPIILTIFALANIDFKLAYQLIVWAIVYIVFLMFLLLKMALNRQKISISISPVKVIVALMLAWLLISSLENQAFNLYTILYISYFLIFFCFYSLDKKYQRMIINLLIGVIAISCVMGFIDPMGKFMPGFNNVNPMALHFSNPNYSAYIVATLAIVVFGFFNYSTTRIANIFYLVAYLIFATHLFINGTFIAISAVVLIEFLMQIIVGAKHKKCQYKMLVLFLVLIPICFLVDLIPNIQNIRTCKYNYFIEGVAVFDNIFGTKILSLFNIDKVAGADGWSRASYIKDSFEYSTSSVSNFVFGGGAGAFNQIRPHNAFLSLFVDFGIVMPLLYIALLIMVLIPTLKLKFNPCNFCFIMSAFAFIACSLMGSIIYNSYYVFLIILALLSANILSQNTTAFNTPDLQPTQQLPTTNND